MTKVNDTEPLAAHGMVQCPCGSGYAIDTCCGFPGRTALNAPVVAKLQDGVLISNGSAVVSENLRKASTRLETPELYPAQINFSERRAFFVKMTADSYRQSVFLDPARMKGSCVIETTLDELAKIADKLRWRESIYIFHTAFCGSTLMAQALEANYHCLPLKEPECLGNVLVYMRGQAGEDGLVWLDRCMRLLARTYSEQEIAVVKVNDYVNPLLLWLRQRRSTTPMLFMYTPVEEFLAGCIKAENRKRWLLQRVNSVKPLLEAILPGAAAYNLSSDDFGGLAALYWSYNIALFWMAWEKSPTNLWSLDFNQLLANPEEVLLVYAKRLNLPPRQALPGAIVVATVFDRYSKNSSHQYSAIQRQDDLAQLLNDHPQHRDRALQVAKELLGERMPTRDTPLPG